MKFNLYDLSFFKKQTAVNVHLESGESFTLRFDNYFLQLWYIMADSRLELASLDVSAWPGAVPTFTHDVHDPIGLQNL